MGQNLTYRPLPGSRLNMAHPMARNMALCMLFNEQGSRAMDLSPYQANGRLHGFGSPAKRHIGGLDFDSSIPSYVEIPASFSQLNFTSEDFSVIARLYLTTLTDHVVIVQRGLDAIDGWKVALPGNARLQFVTSQDGTKQESFTNLGGISTATWFTLGVSRSGASAILFLAGVDETIIPATHQNPTTSTRTTKIGIYDNLTLYPLDGKMEFLYIYRNRALSELEHRAVHESPYSPMGYNLFI